MCLGFEWSQDPKHIVHPSVGFHTGVRVDATTPFLSFFLSFFPIIFIFTLIRLSISRRCKNCITRAHILVHHRYHSRQHLSHNTRVSLHIYIWHIFEDTPKDIYHL